MAAERLDGFGEFVDHLNRCIPLHHWARIYAMDADTYRLCLEAGMDLRETFSASVLGRAWSAVHVPFTEGRSILLFVPPGYGLPSQITPEVLGYRVAWMKFIHAGVQHRATLTVAVHVEPSPLAGPTQVNTWWLFDLSVAETRDRQGGAMAWKESNNIGSLGLSVERLRNMSKGATIAQAKIGDGDAMGLLDLVRARGIQFGLGSQGPVTLEQTRFVEFFGELNAAIQPHAATLSIIAEGFPLFQALVQGGAEQLSIYLPDGGSTGDAQGRALISRILSATQGLHILRLGLGKSDHSWKIWWEDKSFRWIKRANPSLEDREMRSREALERLKHSAEVDENPFGLFNLGCWYLNGGGIVKKDPRKAAVLFRKAAQQGHSCSMHNLANQYFDGNGLKMDLFKAFKWWQKAAWLGDSEAQASLSRAYTEGYGTVSDYAEAFIWAKLAAERGSARGREQLQYVEAVLMMHRSPIEQVQKSFQARDAQVPRQPPVPVSAF